MKENRFEVFGLAVEITDHIFKQDKQERKTQDFYDFRDFSQIHCQFIKRKYLRNTFQKRVKKEIKENFSLGFTIFEFLIMSKNVMEFNFCRNYI